MLFLLSISFFSGSDLFLLFNRKSKAGERRSCGYKMFRFMPVFFILCFFSSFGMAEVRVKSSVNPQAVPPQSVLTFTVEIEYDSEKNIGAPRLPGLGAFHLLGQHQLDYSQSVNGVITKKKQYHYQLQPLQEGKFKIGSAEVVVDGKLYKTSPLEIVVSSKAAPAPPASPFGGFHFRGSPFGRGIRGLLRPFFDEDLEEKGISLNEKDVFLKMETDLSKVYLNEMILVKWFLYVPYNHTLNIESVTKKPKLEGFWVESISPLGTAASNFYGVEEIKGKKYKKHIVLSSALFPMRAGELDIGILEVKSRPIFSTPLKIFLKKSNRKKIQVLPLPKKGRGVLFTEAVGDFNITASVNKKIVSVDDPIVYKVHFKGKGHPRVIRLPDLQFGDSWELYDTTESQKFSVEESIKDFEVILIPKSSGQQVIPSFELSTFDPQLGIYKTHILPSFEIKVVGVHVPGMNKDKSVRYFNQAEQNKKNGEVRKTDESVKEDLFTPWLRHTNSSSILRYGKTFWIVVYGLLFLFSLLLIKKNFSFRKKGGALKTLLKKDLKRVNQAIKKQDWKQAGIELNQLMYSFFSDLSGQNRVVKNWDVLLRDVHPSIRVQYEPQIRTIIAHLEQLSFAAFETAGELRNRENVEKIKNQLVALLMKIDDEHSSI